MPLVLFITAGTRLQAQKGSQTKEFLIDPSRPYVYLRFDHLGPGIRRDESESPSRIWLLLTNNCRVPIIVSTYGVPEGSPKDEQGVMDEVVPNPEVGPIPLFGTGPQAQTPTSQGKESATENRAAEVPRGYMSEVGSFQSIPSGRATLFSVPINHVGKQWHLEIPFSFDLPRGKGFRDPSVGGEPKMAIIYTLYDLPPRYQGQVGP